MPRVRGTLVLPSLTTPPPRPPLLIHFLSFSGIIEALSKTIEINHRSVLNAITSKLPLNESKAPLLEVMDEEMTEETEADASLRRLREELPTELDQEIKLVGYLLSAQRISAEVLSNIVCTQEDEEMADDADDRSDAESVQDYDITQQTNGAQRGGDKIPIEIVEVVKSQQIVEKVRRISVNFREVRIPHGVSKLLFDSGQSSVTPVGDETVLLRFYFLKLSPELF